MFFKSIIIDNKKLLIPIPEKISDCFELIKSDQFRKSGKVVSIYSIIFQMIFRPFSSTLIWLRLCYFGESRVLFYPFRLMYRISSLLHNINIPISTTIGYGLFIGHGTSIVINDKTIIGNNVNISHFVTIGSNYGTPAVICDNVYIGPTSCIVENVIIGENSIIGAGAVVTRNVPNNTTSVGVPSIIIHKHKHNFIQNPWPIQNE